jgi:hypothetical protein
VSEPIEERTEEAWFTFLNRFDEHIYPVLFEPRGYTKAEALLVWSTSQVEATLDMIVERLDERV